MSDLSDIQNQIEELEEKNQEMARLYEQRIDELKRTVRLLLEVGDFPLEVEAMFEDEGGGGE